MDKTLFEEINEEIKLKSDLAESIGVDIKDLPQELINEIMGGALGMTEPADVRAGKARAGEREWRNDLSQRQQAAKERQGQFRAPEAAQHEANVGDFVVVGGKPMKIIDKKKMFGDSEFVYLQGARKPVMVDNLKLAKKVGNVKVFTHK